MQSFHSSWTAATLSGHTLTLYTLPKTPSPSSPTICHFSIGSTSRVMLGYSFRAFFFTLKNSSRRNDMSTFDYSLSGEMLRSRGRFTSRSAFVTLSDVSLVPRPFKWIGREKGRGRREAKEGSGNGSSLALLRNAAGGALHVHGHQNEYSNSYEYQETSPFGSSMRETSSETHNNNWCSLRAAMHNRYPCYGPIRNLTRFKTGVGGWTVLPS